MVGAGILAYEYLYGEERKPLKVPVRAIVYAVYVPPVGMWLAGHLAPLSWPAG